MFKDEEENNNIKKTVERAVEEKINLKRADLEGAYLGGANLRGAYLGGAYLGGAYLEGADLGGAYLGGAYLGGADLGGADLGEADLGEADLGGVNLRGANLGGADLRGANLKGAYIYLDDYEIKKEEVLNNFKADNIRITGTYINKYIFPTRWNVFWKYGLIITDYETKTPKKKMTIEEIRAELGYDFELIKSEEE